MLVCRICLSLETNVTISGHTRTMMRHVLGISIVQNDGLPNKLCQKCNRVISSAYKLKLLAKKTYSILMNSIKLRENDTNLAIEIKIENTNDDDENIKREISEDDNYHNDDFDYASNNKIDSENSVGWKFDSLEENDNKLSIKDEDSSDSKPLNTLINAPVTTIINVPGEDKHLRIKHEKINRISKSKSKDSSSVCDLCGKEVKNLKIHRRRHMITEKKFKCERCPKVFSTSPGLKKHINIDHLGLLYYCELCKKYYKRGRDHKRYVHGNIPRNIPCLLCNLKFTRPGELKFHMSTHTKEKPYACPICGKAFRTNFLCDSHKRRVHDQERSKICQYCSKAFFSDNQLDSHLTTHTKEKNYECNECGKRFSLRGSLKVHILRHTGIKNVKCTVCDKKFFTAGALSTHMKSHTKEKKHECKYCGVKFGRTDHRNRHEKTAHENKRFYQT